MTQGYKQKIQIAEETPFDPTLVEYWYSLPDNVKDALNNLALTSEFVRTVTVRDYTIPVNTQQVVHGTYTIDHTITIDGELVVD